ncbi:MAG: hypothetical protein V3W06_02115, partial [Acidimicrobiia bacterium]
PASCRAGRWLPSGQLWTRTGERWYLRTGAVLPRHSDAAFAAWCANARSARLERTDQIVVFGVLPLWAIVLSAGESVSSH